MRVRIFSDLHLEFAPFEPLPVDADLVIAAGDVDLKEKGLDWLRTEFGVQPVVYVLGNHEYYGSHVPRLAQKLAAKAADTSIAVLENKVLDYGGYRLFGATLWTDFNLFGNRHDDAAAAGEGMTDYQRIRYWPSHRKITPRHICELHVRSLAMLESFLQAGDPRKSVVVTHHAPSIHSLPLAWRIDPLSSAYASALDALIERYQPLLWIHGHIHRAVDYRIGATRIISNPRGYPNEVGVGFRPQLTVDLP